MSLIMSENIKWIHLVLAEKLALSHFSWIFPRTYIFGLDSSNKGRHRSISSAKRKIFVLRFFRFDAFKQIFSSSLRRRRRKRENKSQNFFFFFSWSMPNHSCCCHFVFYLRRFYWSTMANCSCSYCDTGLRSHQKTTFKAAPFIGVHWLHIWGGGKVLNLGLRGNGMANFT